MTSGHGDAEDLRGPAAVEPDVLAHVRRHAHDDLGDDGDRDRREQERAGARDEDEIDDLGPYGGTAVLDLERRLEAVPERRHHPRGRPEEHDEREQPQRARGAREPRDRVLDRARSLLVERQQVDDPVDHLRATAVVLQHDAHDRDEHDRERREREQHAVRDRGRVLRQPGTEVGLARRRHDADELRSRSSAGRASRLARDGWSGAVVSAIARSSLGAPREDSASPRGRAS